MASATTTAVAADNLSRRTTVLFAVTAGLVVGNLYFPQAITPLIASGLHAAPGAASWVVIAVQAGYTAGFVILVPLGDRLSPRVLIGALVTLTALGLAAAAAAPSLSSLVTASAFIGLTSVGVQLIGPVAAGLAGERRCAEVLGTLLSGSIAGMLLGRAFAGSLGGWLGWRAPYLLSAIATLALAAVLVRSLPGRVSASRESYATLLSAPLRSLRSEPGLRRSCFYQAMLFAGFTAVWISLAPLLTGPSYRLGPQAVGTMALVGGVTMLCTPVAGRYIDRRGSDRVNLLSMLGALAAAGILLAGGIGGVAGLVAIVGGTLLLDVAMQSGMVANQARFYAVQPGARNRCNSAYMTCAYLGGSLGSTLSAAAYRRAGWSGTCVLLAALAAAALVRHISWIATRAGQSARTVSHTPQPHGRRT